jgi:hypothetical protein
MSPLHVSLLTMAMHVFDSVQLWGAGHVCGVERHMGRKLAMSAAVDRRADEQPKN